MYITGIEMVGDGSLLMRQALLRFDILDIHSNDIYRIRRSGYGTEVLATLILIVVV